METYNNFQSGITAFRILQELCITETSKSLFFFFSFYVANHPDKKNFQNLNLTLYLHYNALEQVSNWMKFNHFKIQNVSELESFHFALMNSQLSEIHMLLQMFQKLQDGMEFVLTVMEFGL